MPRSSPQSRRFLHHSPERAPFGKILQCLICKPPPHAKNKVKNSNPTILISMISFRPVAECWKRVFRLPWGTRDRYYCCDARTCYNCRGGQNNYTTTLRSFWNRIRSAKGGPDGCVCGGCAHIDVMCVYLYDFHFFRGTAAE